MVDSGVRTGPSFPWPSHYVPDAVPSKGNVSDFKNVLADAKDERPLQTALANTPTFLRSLIPSTKDVWVFDRPSFGGELIPDFLISYRNSTGFNWVYVELESPAISALNNSGRPSGKLTEALGQIRDWRIWLRDNIAYAQSHLGLQSIDAECRAIVIIGRRALVQTKHAARYRELSNGNVEVMSYDRLLDK